MSTDNEQDDGEQEDMCSRALEAGLHRGVTMCEGIAGIHHAIKPFFGLERGEGPPPQELLANSVPDDPTARRQWVCARTAEVLEDYGDDDDMDVSAAAAQAWSEATPAQSRSTDDHGPTPAADPDDDSGHASGAESNPMGETLDATAADRAPDVLDDDGDNSKDRL
jgi:hypothetical protein